MACGLIDVITQPYQYDGYGNGNNAKYLKAMDYYQNGVVSNNSEKVLMDECMEIVTPILDGTESDITGKITYFHSFENPEDWTYHYDYTFVPIDKEGFDNFYFYKYE